MVLGGGGSFARRRDELLPTQFPVAVFIEVFEALLEVGRAFQAGAVRFECGTPSWLVSLRAKAAARSSGLFWRERSDAAGAGGVVGAAVRSAELMPAGSTVAGGGACQASASCVRRATISRRSFATSTASARSEVRRSNSVRFLLVVSASFPSPSRTRTVRRGHPSGLAALPVHAQKMGRVRRTESPLSVAVKFWPSPRYSGGSVTPAAAPRVGRRSTAEGRWQKVDGGEVGGGVDYSGGCVAGPAHEKGNPHAAFEEATFFAAQSAAGADTGVAAVAGDARIVVAGTLRGFRRSGCGAVVAAENYDRVLRDSERAGYRGGATRRAHGVEDVERVKIRALVRESVEVRRFQPRVPARREVAPAQSSAKRKTRLGFGVETAAETGRSKTNEPRTSAQKMFMIGTWC